MVSYQTFLYFILSGKNVETDLKTEHKVRSRKGLLNGLGANKSDVAAKRATSASDTIDVVVSATDAALDIKAPSNRHTRATTIEDKERLARLIIENEPFKLTPGRKMPGCSAKSLKNSPFAHLQAEGMKKNLQTVIQRIIDREAVYDSDSEDEDEEAAAMEAIFVNVDDFDNDDNDNDDLEPLVRREYMDVDSD